MLGVDLSFNFDKIWKLKVPPRVRSFLWMISIDRLPTKEFLIRRGVKLGQLRTVALGATENRRLRFIFSSIAILLRIFREKFWIGGR